MTTHLGYKRLKNWALNWISRLRQFMWITFLNLCVIRHRNIDMAKLKNLENKVVWITGLLLVWVKALARECALQGAGGADLTSLWWTGSGACRFCSSQNVSVSIAADITDEAQVRHAHEQVLACKGRIDWLINNAGLSQRALIQDNHHANWTCHHGSGLFFTGVLYQDCVTNIPQTKVWSVVFVPVWRVYWVPNIAPVIRLPKRRFICGQTVFARRFQKMGLRFRWFSQALLKPMSLLMP